MNNLIEAIKQLKKREERDYSGALLPEGGNTGYSRLRRR